VAWILEPETERKGRVKMNAYVILMNVESERAETKQGMKIETRMNSFSVL